MLIWIVNIVTTDQKKKKDMPCYTQRIPVYICFPYLIDRFVYLSLYVTLTLGDVGIMSCVV